MRGDDIVQLSDNDAEYAKTLLQEYELKLTGTMVRIITC